MYPHTATLESPYEGALDTAGNPQVAEVSLSIKGRFEPGTVGENMKSTALFITGLREMDGFDKAGYVLRYQGRKYTVVQQHNYDKHCALWLV